VFCVAYAISTHIFLSGFNSYEYVACLNTQRSDMIAVHSSGNTALVDISYGGRTISENAIATSKGKFFDDRIEAYVVTHYHNYHPGTIDKITRSHFINVVYIPLPRDDDERSVAKTIKSICQNNGVSMRYYTKNGVRISDSSTIVTIPDKIKRSVHDTIRVDIDVSGYTLSYFGGGVIESQSGIVLPETVFFGSHGPLVKEFDDIRQCKVALYSERKVKDSYNIDSKEEYLLEDSEGVEIFRIPRSK